MTDALLERIAEALAKTDAGYHVPLYKLLAECAATIRHLQAPPTDAQVEAAQEAYMNHDGDPLDAMGAALMAARRGR